jgi:hypothetical protein
MIRTLPQLRKERQCIAAAIRALERLVEVRKRRVVSDVSVTTKHCVRRPSVDANKKKKG